MRPILSAGELAARESANCRCLKPRLDALDELLHGYGISAAGKNRLMNFVWDLTSSAQAGRTELFENVNATPVPLLQQRLYEEYDTLRVEQMAGDLAGLS